MQQYRRPYHFVWIILSSHTINDLSGTEPCSKCKIFANIKLLRQIKPPAVM